MELTFSVRTDPIRKDKPWKLAFFLFKEKLFVLFARVIPTCLPSVCTGSEGRFGEPISTIALWVTIYFLLFSAPLLIRALHTFTFNLNCSGTLPTSSPLPEESPEGMAHTLCPSFSYFQALTSLLC